MKLIDGRGRELKIGQRVRIEEDIPSAEGMLYRDSIVKLDEFNDMSKKIRVTDNARSGWGEKQVKMYMDANNIPYRKEDKMEQLVERLKCHEDKKYED